MNIEILENPNLCRTCLKESKDINYIFKPVTNGISIEEKLSYLTNISLAEDDDLPPYICKQCLLKLNISFHFKKNCEEINKILQNLAVEKSKTNDEVTFFIETIENYAHEEVIEEEQAVNVIEHEIPSKVRLTEEEFEKTHLCDECGQIFSSLETLKQHKQLHQPQFIFKENSDKNQKRMWKCQLCSKEYKDTEGLKVHIMSTHTDERPFLCDLCGKGFVTKDMLKVHIRRHTGERPFPCNFCDKKFVTKSARAEHEICHNNIRKFSCEECGKSFSRKSCLKTHKMIHSGVKPYKCTLCNVSFYIMAHLERHLKTQNHKLKYLEYKDKTGEISLKEEMLLNNPDSYEKMYVCELCNKSYQQKTGLIVHMRTHTGERPFLCTYCGRGFTTADGLTCHITTHTGNCPFRCQFCDKGFRKRYNLTEHERAHRNLREFSCDECDKSFSRQQCLKIHKRSHLNRKPHKCSHCTKAFSSTNALKIHLLKHIRIKPFKCTKCNQSFIRQIELKRHEITHAAKQFLCNICEKTFIKYAKLKKHALTCSKVENEIVVDEPKIVICSETSEMVGQ